MDKMDKEILNEIQWTFPLVPRPYSEIAKKFRVSDEEIMQRLGALKENGIVRQLSAIFDTRRLGYKSALVAMAIEPEKLEHVANQINRHPGVSHNYERNHEYNLWFTLAVPPGSDLKSEIDKFSKLSGIKKSRLLPTIKLFKIGVKLEMIEEKKADIKPSEEKKKIHEVKFTATEEDKAKQIQKQIDVDEYKILFSSREFKKTRVEYFVEHEFEIEEPITV